MPRAAQLFHQRLSMDHVEQALVGIEPLLVLSIGEVSQDLTTGQKKGNLDKIFLFVCRSTSVPGVPNPSFLHPQHGSVHEVAHKKMYRASFCGPTMPPMSSGAASTTTRPQLPSRR